MPLFPTRVGKCIVVKKNFRRRRIAGNLVPCYCAASVMYSRTLPQLLIRKTLSLPRTASADGN